MFAVRLFGLIFLVAYSWGMSQAPSDNLNSFGKMVSMLFFIALPALYFLPTYEASKRKHVNTGAIALVNIFLGWTLIGWVVAIAWAFKHPEPLPERTRTAEIPNAEPRGDTKTCPLCAEEIKKTAIRCKHCHADLSDAKVLT